MTKNTTKKTAAKAAKKTAKKSVRKAAPKAAKKAASKRATQAAPQAAKKTARKAAKKAAPAAAKRAAPKRTKTAAPKTAGKTAGKVSDKAAAKTAKKSSPAKKAKKKVAVRTTLAHTRKPIKGEDKSLVKFDPLQRYLSEISQYRLLTREEEKELGIRVREEGDPEAAYMLVTSNLRLVVKIALEFQRVWMQNLLDLIQEGNIGLMQAVRKFDPYKNVKFSYYASFWIKAYILKFIMDNWRLVKIGTTQGQRKLFFKLKKEKQKLIDQGFDPKPKLLSERLGVSEREIIDMDQRLDGWDVSLDAPLKDDSDTERIEFLSTEATSIEDQVAKKEMETLLHQKIVKFRKQMTPRELDIFDQRIFSDTPSTLQEIGDRYGISRERVRQVEKNIVKKMREYFKKEIPDFSVYAGAAETD
jgi:RNA polymerase sigma-32 factor